LPCLGLLEGSFCPHYDGEKERRPSYHKMIQEGQIKPGWAAENSAAVHFVDGKLVNGICSQPEAKVYYVHAENGVVMEDPIEMVHGDIIGSF
jgi:dipeptidase E